jgi:hypothetical protein
MWLYRIIRGAVHLGGDDASDEVDGVVDDAMHLRAAAEGVRILDPVAEPVAF